MIETQEKVIDGIKFFVTPFMAEKQLQIQIKLTKIFGGALGAGFGDVDKKSIMESNLNIGAIVQGLCNQLDTDDTLKLIKELVKNTSTEKGHLSDTNVFNAVFTSQLDILYKVLYFVLEVNYSFLLKHIGSLKEKMMLLMTKESPSFQKLAS